MTVPIYLFFELLLIGSKKVIIWLDKKDKKRFLWTESKQGLKDARVSRKVDVAVMDIVRKKEQELKWEAWCYIERRYGTQIGRRWIRSIFFYVLKENLAIFKEDVMDIFIALIKFLKI